MNQLFSVTPQQADNFFSFHQSLKPGETTSLNPSDEKHRQFIVTMLATADRSEADYPHLFKGLNTFDTSNSTQYVDKVELVDSGKTATGKASATVWAASSGSNVISGGHLMVFDADTGQLLAQGENVSIRSGFVMCPTRAAIALPAGKNHSILYLGHTTTEDGATRFFSYANSVAVADGDGGITVNVLEPTSTPKNGKSVTIAVGRAKGYYNNNDCDYFYTEPENVATPYLICPFVGYVGLEGTVDIAQLTAANLLACVYFTMTDGSTCIIERSLVYTPDSRFINAFSVGSPSNILEFNLLYDSGSYDNTQSIVYNPCSLVNETISYFYFRFQNLPFEGGGSSSTFYVCSTGTPGEPTINCTQIPPLYFMWHCLAKGSLVTLEDGTQKPIEEITNSFRVKTVDGRSLGVSGTVKGIHTSNGTKGENGVYKLTTDDDKSIIATGNHMVFSSAGNCRSLWELAEGDSVITDAGLSTVKSNEVLTYEGMFYALILGNDEEKTASDFPHNNAGYYAGGILNADQDTLRYQVQARPLDPGYMLPRIKAELHQDYLSALNDRRS